MTFVFTKHGFASVKWSQPQKKYLQVKFNFIIEHVCRREVRFSILMLMKFIYSYSTVFVLLKKLI